MKWRSETNRGSEGLEINCVPWRTTKKIGTMWASRGRSNLAPASRQRRLARPGYRSRGATCTEDALKERAGGQQKMGDKKSGNCWRAWLARDWR